MERKPIPQKRIEEIASQVVANTAKLTKSIVSRTILHTEKSCELNIPELIYDLEEEIKNRQLFEKWDYFSVILFGSRLRGDFKKDSDFDILVIVDLNEEGKPTENETDIFEKGDKFCKEFFGDIFRNALVRQGFSEPIKIDKHILAAFSIGNMVSSRGQIFSNSHNKSHVEIPLIDPDNRYQKFEFTLGGKRKKS